MQDLAIVDSVTESKDGDADGTARKDATYAVKGGVLQILSVCAQALLQVHFIVVSRLFGMATYGLYAAAVSALEVLIRLGCFGADKGMYRFVAAHHSRGEEDLEASACKTGLKVSFVFSCSIALVLFFGAGSIAGLLARWSPSPETAVKVGQALPAFAFAVPAGSLAIVLVAVGLSKRIAHISLMARGLAEPCLLLGFGLIAWALSASSVGLGYAHTLALVGTAAIALFVLARAAGWDFISRIRHAGKHPGFVRFVTPLAALEFVNTLRMQIDLLIVLPMLGHESAALYGASAVLGRIGAQIRYAFDGIASPLFSAAIAANDRGRLKANVHYLTRIVTTLSMPLVTTMVALRGELLELYGKEYRAASTIALIHISGHFLNGVLGLTGQVVSMSGYSSVILVIQTVALAANTSTCIFLIPRLGMLGAAIGFAIGFCIVFVGNLATAYALKRVVPFHLALVKPFAAGAVAMAAQLWIATLLSSVALKVAATILVGATLYIATLYALGIEKEDIQMLRRRRL